MNEEIQAVEWENEFRGKTVNEMWNTFIEKFMNGREKYVPKKIKRKKTNEIWMNKKIAKGIKKRNRKWKKVQEWPTTNSRIEYNKLRNMVTSDIRKAKRSLEQKLATQIKENPKLFYSYVRAKSKTKIQVGPLKNSNGQIIGDSKEMTEILNGYFASVFVKERLTISR